VTAKQGEPDEVGRKKPDEFAGHERRSRRRGHFSAATDDRTDEFPTAAP